MQQETRGVSAHYGGEHIAGRYVDTLLDLITAQRPSGCHGGAWGAWLALPSFAGNEAR
jgi:hypothetical protein